MRSGPCVKNVQGERSIFEKKLSEISKYEFFLTVKQIFSIE
jgi:hypothetical protein